MKTITIAEQETTKRQMKVAMEDLSHKCYELELAIRKIHELERQYKPFGILRWESVATLNHATYQLQALRRTSEMERRRMVKLGYTPQ